MYIYRRKAHYHETDKMGVVYHANYIHWMEEARVEYLDSVGLPYRGLEDEGIMSPVTSVSLEYKRPVEFDDRTEVRVRTEGFDGIILKLAYEIWDLTKDCLAVKASSSHCFTRGGRVVSLKKASPPAFGILMKEYETDKEKERKDGEN